jgi:hypothetical protein
MKLKSVLVFAGGLLSLGVGCSSTDEGKCESVTCDRRSSGGAAQGGLGQGGEIFGSNGGAILGGGGAPGAGGAMIDPKDVCNAQAYDPETLPVDILFMFDQSSSMSEPVPPPGLGTWWTAAQQAVISFVNSPDAAGVGVGIQYFPLGGVAPKSCEAVYSTPEVPIADLPANAPAISGSINAHAPTTFTPTGPALAGALAHMKQWAPSRPGRAPIVVLVTDGFPTECEPQQIADIAVLAKNAFETPTDKVRTFVVGFNLGAGKENLNQIAKAGGTDQAFFINFDPANPTADIGQQFVKAMLSITASPLQCAFDIPTPTDGSTIDINKVYVQFTPNLPPRLPEPLPFLGQRGDCLLNRDTGFYFDNKQSPKQIMLCPATCAKLAQGVLETKLGCRPPPGQTM